jgi:hypothetical protein
MGMGGNLIQAYVSSSNRLDLLVKAGGFSASSSLSDGPPGIHAPNVETACNNRKSIFATYTALVDLRIMNRAVDTRIDRGELVRGELMTVRKRSTT